MTATPASMAPTLALMVGGVYWNDYASYTGGGETGEAQEGLMPFAVTGPSDAIIGSILVAPAMDAGSPSMLNLDTDGYLEVNVKAISSLLLADVEAANGAAATTSAVMMGGSDGTDLRYIATDTGGQVKVLVENLPTTTTVVGDAANGGAVSGNPVLMAGSDGTDARTLATYTNGILKTGDQGLVDVITAPGAGLTYMVMVGAEDPSSEGAFLQVDADGYLMVNVESGGGSNDSVSETGAAVPTYATMAGGTDGTDLRALLTDTSGQLKILIENVPVVTGGYAGGTALSGMGASAYPLLMGGSDGTYVRDLAVNSSGQLEVVVEDSVAVTGTFYQTTQPVSIASWGPIVVTSITDTVAVSGTFYQATQPVSIADSVAVTGTFYQTTQPVSNAGLTAIDDVITTTGSTAPTYAVLMGASNGTDLEALQVDSSGFLKVNVAAGSSGNAAASATGGAVPTDADYIGAKNSSGDLVGLLVDASGHLEVSVQQPNNVLLATTAVSVTSTVTTESETASVNGQCVVVTISCVTAKTMAYPVAVRVRDTTTGTITAWQLSPIQVAGGSGCTLYFNLPVTNGDTVDIDVIAQGTVGSGSTDVTAVLSPLSVPTALRPDGRSSPLNSQGFSAYQAAAVVGATAIAAVAGWCILVGSWAINPQGAVLANMTGYLDGGSFSFAQAGSVSSSAWGAAQVFPSGVLLAGDSAVTYATSASSPVYFQCTYDLVPQ